jgi:hypothetical protein
MFLCTVTSEEKEMVTNIIQYYKLITMDTPKIHFEITQTMVDPCVHGGVVMFVHVNIHYKDWVRNENFIIRNKEGVYYMMVSLCYVDFTMIPQYYIDMRKKMDADEIYMCSFPIDQKLWNQRLHNTPLNLLEVCRVFIRNHVLKCKPDKFKEKCNKYYIPQDMYRRSMFIISDDIINQLPVTVEMKKYLNFWRPPGISETEKKEQIYKRLRLKTAIAMETQMVSKITSV